MNDAGNDKNGWRSSSKQGSLADVFRTVSVPQSASFWRKLFAFLGPGFLVSVGYMDPGNWSTAIAGGAQFGYQLLWIAMLANLMAIILQSLTARLGIGSGRDLAQACRDSFGPRVGALLWVLAEIAIIATDLAEVIGTAIALNLLFNIPLQYGVIITAVDVLLVLVLQRYGFRKLEAFIVALLLIIFVCFFWQMFLANPDWNAAAAGLVPGEAIFSNSQMLFLALGIIGATVMPHNLYLHSGIVQTRAFGKSLQEKRKALRFATIDSTFALLLAFIINASILILAAATFSRVGLTQVTDIGEAQTLIGEVLNSNIAPTLFAIALLACGLNSAITATLAGQIVMEGFINFRMQPWARRLLTRTVAIIPAVLVTFYYGGDGTAFILILSQVILAMQLPFAVVPLLLIVGNRTKMKELVAPWWLMVLSWAIAFTIIALNIKFLWDFFLH